MVHNPYTLQILICMSCDVNTCQKVQRRSQTEACTGDSPCKLAAQQTPLPGSADRQVQGYPLANQPICPVPPPSPEIADLPSQLMLPGKFFDVASKCLTLGH